jgi:cation/acetate symporter
MAIAVGMIGVLGFAAFVGMLAQGWNGVWLLGLGGAVAVLIIAFLLAPYLRKFGGYTVPDFLGERFAGTGLRPLAALAVILCSFPALSLLLMALGEIAMRIFGVGTGTGLVLGVAMLLLCSFPAGLRSASLTQVVQYAVLIAVSLMAFTIFFSRHGTLFPALSASDLDKAFAAIRLESFAAVDPVNRFAQIFCLVTGIASLPHLLSRSLVTPSTEEAGSSFLWALPFAAALALLATPYLPLFGPSPSDALEFQNAVAFGLIATGAIAALLASGSGLLLAIANALSYDLYYKGLHLTAPTDQRILIARLALLLVAGLAASAALRTPEMLPPLTGASFSLAASTLLPALLLGIWWPRATPEGALAGMLAGLAVCLYYMLAPRYIPFAFYESSSFLSDASADQAARYAALGRNYYLATDETARQAALTAWRDTAGAVANWWGVKTHLAGVFAAPIGFLMTVGVSLFTPAPSRDVQSLVEDLRKPSVA